MHGRLGLHHCHLEKREDKDGIEDEFFLSEKYSNQRGVVLGKRYHGAADFLHAVIPKKKSVRSLLSREDEEYKMHNCRKFRWTLRFAVVRVLCKLCFV